jgi:hypothetical protein
VPALLYDAGLAYDVVDHHYGKTHANDRAKVMENLADEHLRAGEIHAKLDGVVDIFQRGGSDPARAKAALAEAKKAGFEPQIREALLDKVMEQIQDVPRKKDGSLADWQQRVREARDVAQQMGVGEHLDARLREKLAESLDRARTSLGSELNPLDIDPKKAPALAERAKKLVDEMKSLDDKVDADKMKSDIDKLKTAPELAQKLLETTLAAEKTRLSQIGKQLGLDEGSLGARLSAETKWVDDVLGGRNENHGNKHLQVHAGDADNGPKLARRNDSGQYHPDIAWSSTSGGEPAGHWPLEKHALLFGERTRTGKNVHTVFDFGRTVGWDANGRPTSTMRAEYTGDGTIHGHPR